MCYKRKRKNASAKNHPFLIMKTRLFKYIENFTFKNWKFSDFKLIFFMFVLKTQIVGTRYNRLGEAIFSND